MGIVVDNGVEILLVTLKWLNIALDKRILEMLLTLDGAEFKQSPSEKKLYPKNWNIFKPPNPSIIVNYICY